jgi:hypothetical protein
MSVNLNQAALETVTDYGHKQFVDNVGDIPLTPLYRGALRTFYPTTIEEVKKGRKLRRYIFRYNSDGSFTFLNVRHGQRNGGNNVRPEEAQINVTILDPSNNNFVLRNRNFNRLTDDIFVFGQITRIVKINQRWYWQERSVDSFVFENVFYTDPTPNSLENANKLNDVNWYQIPLDKYVITNTTSVEYFNNNTLAGLNNWPIRNEEVKMPEYAIQDYQNTNGIYSGTLVNETRPSQLDDGYLNKCFKDVVLESYDTVFVEVSWKEYNNKSIYNPNGPAWIGEEFTVPVLKGRVYRVGKLVKSNGVNEFDIVSDALRTKIKTTRTKRGGNNVYN